MNHIHIDNYFFNEEGEFCCEGSLNGVYFQGTVKDNRRFEWKTNKDVTFSTETRQHLTQVVKGLYIENMYLEHDLIN